jgi:hypothetical protein
MPPKKLIYQLKITLKETDPPIWRTIQIPSSCNFWDFHSFIQDAFGWTNSHLHQFIYTYDYTEKPVLLGIPSDDYFEGEEPDLPGWEYKVKSFITGETSKIEYTYDFGDDWQHSIELEQTLPAETGVKYPRCIAGERNGPPEDCGGPHGYADMLEVLFDPDNPEHESTVQWVDSMKGCVFCPETFDPVKVRFMSPKKRFKESFESE